MSGLCVGALLAIIPVTWMRTRLLATYMHEAGHAVMAMVTGRSVLGIRLDRTSSGSTAHSGGRGLGLFLTMLAGYPAPAAVGWAICILVGAGTQRWAIAGLIVLVVLLALFQFSWRGWVVGGSLVAFCLVLYGVSPWWSSVLLAGMAGYLLAATPRTLVSLHRYRRMARDLNEPRHSDADSLAEFVGLPAVFWELIFAAAIVYLMWRSWLAVWGA